jgi:hypothetical protein
MPARPIARAGQGTKAGWAQSRTQPIHRCAGEEGYPSAAMVSARAVFHKTVCADEEDAGWHALRYSEGRGAPATPFGVPQGVPPGVGSNSS